jgi:hypothetical protein
LFELCHGEKRTNDIEGKTSTIKFEGNCRVAVIGKV